jgi:hypothetical protein
MYDLYQAPAIGTFPPANATVGTSIDNQAAPAAPMVGMVGVALQPQLSHLHTAMCACQCKRILLHIQ